MPDVSIRAAILVATYSVRAVVTIPAALVWAVGARLLRRRVGRVGDGEL